MKRLSDLGEDALVRRLLACLPDGGRGDGRVVVGPGDDCAVVDVGREGFFQLLKTDCVIEGVHYLPETPAAEVGWKAVARVMSDFAAMGGWPGQLLVMVAMPGGQTVAYLEELYEGMQRCASGYGAEICGGETSSVPEGSAAMVSVSGTGWVEKGRQVTRAGGRVGERVMVTGRLGGSIGGKHLSFSPRLEEARWLTEHFPVSSMMDLSDGLARDLPRLAAASGCGFRLNSERILCSRGCDLQGALNDGEDYELLFTVPAEQVAGLAEAWRGEFPELELSDVGELVETGDGARVEGSGGWEHFS